MKINLWWQVALALVCMGLAWKLVTLSPPTPTNTVVSATDGQTTGTSVTDSANQLSQDGGNNQCVASIAADGGWLSIGMIGAPHSLLPIFSESNPIDRELVDLIFDGLTRYDEQGRLQPELAESWEVAEDKQTVTFTLREDRVWHDGQPVTANDVAYTYGLLQDPAFNALPHESALWQSTEIAVLDQRRIQFTLPAPYSPFLEATTRGILPAHLLNGTSSAELMAHPFAQQPIGTGPFRIINQWREDGFVLLIPSGVNNQGISKAYLNGIQFSFYANAAALFGAYDSGIIHAVSGMQADLIPTAAAAEGMRLYTARQPRYSQLLFNLRPDQNSPTAEAGVRSALSLAIDKNQLITQAINGQALTLGGPYLPNSLAYDPGLSNVNSFNPISATQTLDATGWVVPTDTIGSAVQLRQKEELPLSLRLVAVNHPESQAAAISIATQWTQIGAEVDVQLLDPAAYQTALQTFDFDAAIVDIRPIRDPDLYDFWSQEAIIRGQNYAGWNNRRASEALEAARQVWDQDERKAYYAAFLQFYEQERPALTLYQTLTNYGVSDEIKGVEAGVVSAPRDFLSTFDQWYIHTEDVSIECE